MKIKDVITHKKEMLSKNKNFKKREKRLIESIKRHKKEMRFINKRKNKEKMYGNEGYWDGKNYYLK